MQAAAKRFFQSPYFAVAGASSNQAKFGYKVLAWYHAHDLPATPINPTSASITITTPSSSTTIPTVPNISALPNPKETALSVITPPWVTKPLLEEAHKLGMKSVWLQPGTFDEPLLKWAKEEVGFENLIAGEVEKTGHEGWCVLIHGEEAMAEREKSGKL
ncbi:hypothetical protein MMC25_001889 [Agyrium rufum]|nr:hypothetical protein [Agyrium rufum]